MKELFYLRTGNIAFRGVFTWKGTFTVLGVSWFQGVTVELLGFGLDVYKVKAEEA